VFQTLFTEGLEHLHCKMWFVDFWRSFSAGV
jgi:hypothetical protein